MTNNDHDVEQSAIDTRRDHIIIAGAGQWGQQAADHLLNRAIAFGGLVTVVIERRNEHAFRNFQPTYSGWSEFNSVKACIDSLRKLGKPIRYIYDDHFNHLAAELIEQRASESHRTVGYVTSASEDHLAMACFLVDYCERVLIEKPLSKIWDDVKIDGKFEKLAEKAKNNGCCLKAAEHYLFRPGVEHAWHLKEKDETGLKAFLRRHKKCDLKFEFQFCEKADRDDPERRLGAYLDGAILDVLTSHGLGPLSRLVIPALACDADGNEVAKLIEGMTLSGLHTWYAKGNDRRPRLPIFSETAAQLSYDLKIGDANLSIELKSAKGCDKYDRFFRVSCAVETCSGDFFPGSKSDSHVVEALDLLPDVSDKKYLPQDAFYYGVSLGAAGFTSVDLPEPEKGLLHVEREGGHLSDRAGMADSAAANAHAAMLNELLGPEFEALDGRFLSIAEACAITRKGIEAQTLGFAECQRAYRWAASTPEWQGNTRNLDADNSKYNRFITVLGSRGSGKRYFYRELIDALTKCPFIVTRDIDVPDIGPGTEPIKTKDELALGRICRDLADTFGLRIPVDEPPEVALRKTLKRHEEDLKMDRRSADFDKNDHCIEVLLIYGINRLPSTAWRSFVKLLKLLPRRIRIVFFTTEGAQASGHVVRVATILQPLWAAENVHDAFEQAITTLQRSNIASADMCDQLRELFDGKADADEQIAKELSINVLNAHLEDLKARLVGTGNATVSKKLESAVRPIFHGLKYEILKYADYNPAVGRFLTNLLCLMIIPRYHRQLLTGGEEHNRADWVKILRDEIAALMLPQPKLENSGALLQRLAGFYLAELEPGDCSFIRDLARIEGPYTKSVQHTIRMQPGPAATTLDECKIGFSRDIVDSNNENLYPHVRQAALSLTDDQLEYIRADIQHRRAILALASNLSTADPDYSKRVERLIDLLLRAKLDRINFDGGPFEQVLERIVEDAYDSIDLVPVDAVENLPINSILERFVDPDAKMSTNLSLPTRSRFAHLYGILINYAAGHRGGVANQGLVHIRHAFRIAERNDVDNDAWLLAIQAWKLVRLRQGRVWHLFLFEEISAQPRDPAWDPGDGSKHWLSINWPSPDFEIDQLGDFMRKWNPSEPSQDVVCGTATDINVNGNKFVVSPRTKAIAFRTAALYFANRAFRKRECDDAKTEFHRAMHLLFLAHSLNLKKVRVLAAKRNWYEANVLFKCMYPAEKFSDKTCEDGIPGEAPCLEILFEFFAEFLASRQGIDGIQDPQPEKWGRRLGALGEPYLSQLMYDVGKRKGKKQR